MALVRPFTCVNSKMYFQVIASYKCCTTILALVILFTSVSSNMSVEVASMRKYYTAFFANMLIFARISLNVLLCNVALAFWLPHYVDLEA